jgi:hypothetical protein
VRKDADPRIPVQQSARAEFAKLQWSPARPRYSNFSCSHLRRCVRSVRVDKKKWDRHECLSHRAYRLKLERTQEIQEILLLLRTQLSEIADDAVGFRTGASVFLDGVEKIRGAAIMQEENTLTEAPQRR